MVDIHNRYHASANQGLAVPSKSNVKNNLLELSHINYSNEEEEEDDRAFEEQRRKFGQQDLETFSK